MSAVPGGSLVKASLMGASFRFYSPTPTITGVPRGDSCEPLSGSSVTAKFLASTPSGSGRFTTVALPRASGLNRPAAMAASARQRMTGVVRIEGKLLHPPHRRPGRGPCASGAGGRSGIEWASERAVRCALGVNNSSSCVNRYARPLQTGRPQMGAHLARQPSRRIELAARRCSSPGPQSIRPR